VHVGPPTLLLSRGLWLYGFQRCDRGSGCPPSQRRRRPNWTGEPSSENDQTVEIRIQCLCVDSADPSAVAAFWEAALGWRRTWDEEDQVVLEPPAGSSEDGIVPDLLFLKVPEKKAGKNRLHLDLRPADQSAEVARLEALGARRVSVGQGDVGWVVMADPEGNEFDVLPQLTPAELPPGHDALGRRIAGVE
jgi:hypothetical protein